MLRKFKVFLSAAVALSATPSLADNLTGNDLLAACEDELGSVPNAFCSGYVIGVVEGMKWGAALIYYQTNGESATAEDANYFANQNIGYCAPHGVTYGQYVGVLTKYLEANPETRHQTARTLAQRAFHAAFPCD